MSQGSDRGVVSLSIPAKAEYIALCRLALAGLAQVRALEPETLADLKVALTEACSNSIRHAYEAAGGGAVDIRYEVDDDKVVVEVTDTGAGFDADDVDAADGELDEGGLGIAIIRAVVDDVTIASDGGGSRLRFVKYLA